MDIVIVVPPFARDRFSGGIWCVMQHAQQLGQRGHRVTVVPSHPCPLPEWFPRPWAFTVLCVPAAQALGGGVRALARAGLAVLGYKLRRGSGPPSPAQEAAIRKALGLLGQGVSNFSSYGHRQGGALDHLAGILPEADLTLATDTETAWPVRLLGKGRLASFSQHYEPYFWKERLGGTASRREAQMAYHLGLQPLVNSPWLQQMLQQELPGVDVQLVPNAIDHQVFTGSPCIRAPDEPLRLISYGGRSAQWKGFEQMCQALALVKARHPELRFEWSVYGDSLLPPDNSIFPYRPLGFLKPGDLAQAYRSHHVLLSASWYESFPLFPIEAMACGLAAITTQPGTELFAQHENTAWVVPPRDPQALADAVVRLARDEALRQRLAAQGQARSHEFTWGQAGLAMEAALKHIVALPLAANPAD